MAVQTQSFTKFVQNMVTAMQASAGAATPPMFLDFNIGTVLRALVESVASTVALFLQGLALQVLALTRLATSNGTDADSWVADFGFTRLPGVASTGSVTFARFTPTLQAVVPIGAGVQTGDGTQQFTVTLDTTNTAYNAGLGGYVLAPGVSSVNVPVQAASAVAASNVLAATIVQMTTPISGVDTVTNGAAFTNGADPESDAAMRARFVLFIAALAKATKTAIGAAISNVQQNLTFTISENLDYPGTGPVDNGNFFVVVDDGSGSPSGTLLASVNNAIDIVRPLGSRFTVNAPTKVVPTIAMTITTAAGAVHANIVALVTTALVNFVNAIPLGAGSIPFTRLAQVAYDASPSVINVTSVLLNGVAADYALTAVQVPRIVAGNVTVT